MPQRSSASDDLAAVLWDMDGTLVRTEELWLLAEERTMAAFGSHWDAQDQAVAVGGPLDRVVTYMASRVGRSEQEVGELLVAEIEGLMHAEEIPWMPGALDLHNALVGALVPQALVSNSWRELMDAALAELDTAFDVVVAGDEVDRPKPDPQPYETAARLLGADPANTVVLEDSPTGVAAALAAGCWVIGVPHVSDIAAHPRLLLVQSLAEVSIEVLNDLAAGRILAAD